MLHFEKLHFLPFPSQQKVLLNPDKIGVSKFYFSLKSISEFGRYLELKVCASAWNQQAKVNCRNLMCFSNFL